MGDETPETVTISTTSLLRNLEDIAKDHQGILKAHKGGCLSRSVHHVIRDCPYEPESFKVAAKKAVEQYRENPENFPELDRDLVEAGLTYINDGSIAF